MFLATDTILGPCPTHCGGCVWVSKGETQPRCEHCDYRVKDVPAYQADLTAWRERVMGPSQAEVTR